MAISRKVQRKATNAARKAAPKGKTLASSKAYKGIANRSSVAGKKSAIQPRKRK